MITHAAEARRKSLVDKTFETIMALFPLKRSDQLCRGHDGSKHNINPRAASCGRQRHVLFDCSTDFGCQETDLSVIRRIE